MRYLAAILVMFLVTPVHAKVKCADRQKVIMKLGEKYREHPVAAGLARSGGITELLISEDGKTWTIIVTMPAGLSCLVSAGEGWEVLYKPGARM